MNIPVIRTGAYHVVEYHPWIESYFTKVAKYGEPMPMCKKVGNTLWIPRELLTAGGEDHRVKYSSIAIDCNFTPRNDEQKPLAEKSVALLTQGYNHVFEAPTGWGKTVVGGLIACKLGQPTLVVVTKQDLMEAWEDAFINVLGISPSKVGKVQQDECAWKGKQFVIGMLHSLIIPDRYPQVMYDHFGMVIFDEVHLMPTECFEEVCWKFPAYYRLGFSATPERSDGREELITAHIGKTMVKGTLVPMKPKVLVRQTGWRIPEHKAWVGGVTVYKPIPHSPGRMMLVSKAQAASQERNLIITLFVKAAYEAGRNVLIMSDMKEYHLDRLFQMFASYGISGADIGYYVGGMSKIERGISSKKKVVLATYKMCSTGTNVPHWDTLVMATPRANIKQIIGRVMRFVEAKKQPVILDLVDGNSIFKNFFQSRLKQYYSVGAEIVKV